VTIPNRSLSQRLVLYGLGAGAVGSTALGARPPNHIVYSGPVEFSGNTIYFDLQNFTPPSSSFMSEDDFKMKSNCSKSKAKIKFEGANRPQVAASVLFNRPYALKFQSGQTLGTQDFYSTAYFNYLDRNGAGYWHAGDRGFLALRITINCQSFYGWADVTLNRLNCVGSPAVFTLHSYAINTEPNESIKAGEKKEKTGKRNGHIQLPPPTCSPSPSATVSATTPPTNNGSAGAAIALLLAGASGVAALKQNRKTSFPN
jgi:hypothetical protein